MITKQELQDMLDQSRLLFYGELEYYLDIYLPKFFKVEVKDVGLNDNHEMNNLEFWFTVSWLESIGVLEYGTSPRTAWLTDEGLVFKEYVLSTPKPITTLLYRPESD